MADRHRYFQYKLLDLHQAVLKDDVKLVELLLRKPSTDINKRNTRGETPLFLSLKENRSDQFIMRLIQADCDPNISNIHKVTPLHLAVQRSTTDIADELIKRGADINAQETQMFNDIFRHTLGSQYVNRKTPLHYAIECNQLKMVCLLLYHGADVYITSSDMGTPLKYAVLFKRETIVTMLMNYYDKSYFSDQSIINKFGINNYMECEGIALLKYALKHSNPEIFKSIWYGIDQQMLWNSPNGCETLLVNYTNQCMFITSDWLECLYLMLTSSFIHSDVKYINEHLLFFIDLCLAFHRRRIKFNDRMALINICLSLGIVPNRDSLSHAHLLYGFNEEYEALLYSTHELESIVYCFPSFIISLEECDPEIILEIFKFHFSCCTLYRNTLIELVKYCINMLGFFALPQYTKVVLKVTCNQQAWWTPLVRNDILKKIDNVPKFPSLLELSRNKIRKLIRQSCKAKVLYQYQDVINSFNLPQPLKDILRFKKPLYID